MLTAEVVEAEPSDEDIRVAAEAAIARCTPKDQIHRGPLVVELPGAEAPPAPGIADEGRR